MMKYTQNKTLLRLRINRTGKVEKCLLTFFQKLRSNDLKHVHITRSSGNTNKTRLLRLRINETGKVEKCKTTFFQ
jgi:adenylate cyclase class IV